MVVQVATADVSVSPEQDLKTRPVAGYAKVWICCIIHHRCSRLSH
jgi:hypothetical protein